MVRISAVISRLKYAISCVVLSFGLVFIFAAVANAQPVHFELAAGGGLSFATIKDANVRYKGDAGALIFANIYIPLGKIISLKTGVGYEWRSIKSFSSVTDEDGLRLDVDGAMQYHFITIPLQVTGAIPLSKTKNIYVTGGMNYHFLVHALVNAEFTSYSKNNQVSLSSAFSYQPEIRFAPSSNQFNKNPQSGLLLFNPAIYLDVAYPLFKRSRIKAFYEYNLNGIDANPGDSGTMKLHFAGIMLDYCLTK